LNCVGILSSQRHQNILKIDPDIIHWDIRKGLPFENDVFDVVYHSHFIGHLDRNVARYVTVECLRTLKSGGIIRVVVPDLQQIVNLYNEAAAQIEAGDSNAHKKYDKAINNLFELMVRNDSVGTSSQAVFIRTIERLIRGGIDSRGELRRWHYDKFSMTAMLRDAGFKNICSVDASKSRISGWNEFGLDLHGDGTAYKTGSLYMEAVK
ncbi:MAG: methyltransferase domain-containing protein, partial [Sedimentisphaerales bacterium]|nr:methyltransferase domain-containing protein [Sedimentisphaerales bacterium]